MVKNESFVIIQGWMINELGLKGNDLIAYAIIYGFSQDGESTYKGGQDYLAGWAKCTTRGIRKNLTSLLEKKLILVKNVAYVNGHKVCDYAVNMDFVPNQQEQSSKTKEIPQEQSSKTTGTKFQNHRNKVPKPQEQSSSHNIKSNILDNIESKKGTYQQIADMYNEICISFPRLTVLSERRKKALKARMKIYNLDDFKKLFEKMEKSDFLKGANDRDWSADFEWAIKDANMAKILEGKYDNKESKNTKVKVNQFNSFHQREYTQEEYDVLEKAWANKG